MNKDFTKKTKNNKGLLKLTYLNTEFIDNEEMKSCQCNINCRVNIDKLENNICFTEKFMRNILSKYVDVYADEVTRSTRIVCGRKQSDAMGCDTTKHYDYAPFFTVTAFAACHPNDTYDKTKGRIIAEARAKKQALAIVNNLTKELIHEYQKLINECEKFIECVDYYKSVEAKRIDKMATE